MYEQTFQFSSRPFNSVPRTADFFAGQSYQQAMTVAHMCVDRSTGPVVVVGAAGMGKSLLLQKIGESFSSRFDVVQIECSRLEARSELLQSILFELNLPYAGLSEGELRLSLMGYLKEIRGADDGVLLLVDEADRLSVELIDELRLISNQIRDGRSLVQLVLAGTRRLEDALTDPKLTSFNQRIAARCLLQNLSKDETKRFIFQHVQRAGRAGGDVFDEEAVDEIHLRTDGCPRLINQLCDQALLLAAGRQQEPVDRQLIREAWSEMQNMPLMADVSDTSVVDSHAQSGVVVEFGQLSDPVADSATAEAETDFSYTDPFAAEASESVGALADAEDEPEQTEAQHDVIAEESLDDEEGTSAGLHQADVEETDVEDAHGNNLISVVEGDQAEDAQTIGEDLGPAAMHAAAAALAASAFAANTFNSDPFAPKVNDQPVEDDSAESEKITALQQEQESLLEQTRGLQPTGDYNEVNSAFEAVGVNEQEDDTPRVDDMVPADPFSLSEESQNGSAVDDDLPAEEVLQADDEGGLGDSVEVYDVAETSQTNEHRDMFAAEAASDSEASPAQECPGSMADCSIEEQLGLVEPEVSGPTTSHTTPVETEMFVDSRFRQNETGPSEQVPAEQAPTEQHSVTDGAVGQTEAPATIESVDPFDETFEEEEMLQDAYSPFVAEQNQASLDVTSSQLSHLVPLEENDEADSTDENSMYQTAELAIEELDGLGVSVDENLAADGEEPGQRIGFQEEAQQSQVIATDFSEVPMDNWQDHPETAWDPSQLQKPVEFASQADSSADASSLSESPGDPNLPSRNEAGEDPFAPLMEQHPEHASSGFAQQPALQPVDEDLEALTSDLGSAATFDLADEPNVGGSQAAGVGEPADMAGTGMLGLNDLIPSHTLQRTGPEDVQEYPQAHDIANQIQDHSQNSEQGGDSLGAVDQTVGYAAPYVTQSALEDSVTPEDAAQAEARRKTEEFMRTFHAQREVDATQQDVVYDANQQPSSEGQAVSEENANPPEERSQEILKEIFSQQKLLNEVHYTDSFPALADQHDSSNQGEQNVSAAENAKSLDGQGADSVSIESPVTEYSGYQQPGETPSAQDDRDMLYVNESQQYTPLPPQPEPQQPPFPNVEISTGNAQRIDYNQLFDQLRNPSQET